MTTPRRHTAVIVPLATLAVATVPAMAVGTGHTCTPGRNATCRGADLRGAQLRGVDLRGADLRDAHMEGADLRGARLAGARMQRLHAAGARLDRADLTGATLDGADFTRASLPHARLVNAHIGKASRPAQGHHESQATPPVCTPSPNSWCYSPQFAAANLTGASLAGARILWGNFRGANMTGANIAGTIFQFSNLSKATLANSTGVGPVPAGSTTYMRVGAAFNSSTLTGTSFAGANLTGTGFLQMPSPNPVSPTAAANMTGAYVQATWSLNGMTNFNGASWPAASCSYAPVPWGQPVDTSVYATPCTTALAGGGTVTFAIDGGLAATLRLPPATPSWWPRLQPAPTPVTITITPSNALQVVNVWTPPSTTS